MSESYRANITRGSIWMRLVFMIVLAIAFNVAEIVILGVVVFQFLASLFTGEPNDRMARFGRNIGRYLQQIIAFMTFATEERPFPFSPWPDEPHAETAKQNASEQGPKEAIVPDTRAGQTKSETRQGRTKRKSPTGTKARRKPKSTQ